MGIEPTTSGLDLPLLCRLSYTRSDRESRGCPTSWLSRQSNGRSNPEVVGSTPTKVKISFSLPRVVPFTPPLRDFKPRSSLRFFASLSWKSWGWLVSSLRWSLRRGRFDFAYFQRPQYFAAVISFGSRGAERYSSGRGYVPKSIDREGLGESRTGNRQ